MGLFKRKEKALSPEECAAEGPVDTFREREPYVIRFDQADSVAVEVDEYWSASVNRMR